MNINGRHLPRRRDPDRGLTHDGQLCRVLGQFPKDVVSAGGVARLCEACVEVMAMSGASIVVMTDEAPLGSLGATDQVSALLEELQYTLVGGPSVDAHHRRHPIEEPVDRTTVQRR